MNWKRNSSGIWSGGPNNDVNILSSYVLYAQGWQSEANRRSFFRRDYFGAILADGPWYQGNWTPMKSWHGASAPGRGFNVAAIGGEVVWCPATLINPFWSEGFVWSNLWADNAWIWQPFSVACGYPAAYPDIR